MSNTSEFITIIRPARRKRHYEHLCYLCEQVFLSPMQRKIYFCPSCLLEENKTRREAAMAVHHNLHRAKRVGLPATLTVRQWLETLNYFDWQCAYCSGPYECLEHFIPLDLSGGTTQRNVVPSCRKCNSRKIFYAPEVAFGKEAIERVSSYLQMKVESVA